MKKRIKEWILRHEALYWAVVAVVVGLVFGIVTAVGCVKVYKANAAEISVDNIVTSADYRALMEYRNEKECPYYSVVYFLNEDNGAHYLYLFQNENGEPLAHLTPSAQNGYYDNALRLGCSLNGTGWASYVQTSDDGTAKDYPWNYLSCVWGNRVSMYVVDGNMDIGLEVPYCASDVTGRIDSSTTLYDVRSQRSTYSVDAPYITFDRLSVKNLIADGETSKFVPVQNMYKNYTKASTWTYYGTLNNRGASDLEYLLEATFVVEIPTVEYVQDLAYSMDVDMTREHSVLSNAPDMVRHWNSDDRALKNTYEFVYPITITPDIDGHFSYQLPFDTIETLIMYWDEEARERINGYSDDWRAVLLSYLHVDCVTVSVRTVRPDSIVYGKVTTNQFDRGIYDVCMEVIPDIDINTATPEEIDKIITDSLQDAHDKYLADLEQRLEDLEGQLNDVGSLDGAFSGSLEGTGLWSGFKSLAGGIASLGGTVSGISSAIGSVFGFLPVDIQYVMGYTILALCVIAIIKAIRG